MGCINSVPKREKFNIIDNTIYTEHNECDFMDGIVYMKNMEWCLNLSSYVEKLCFTLASYTPEQTIVVKSMATRILTSNLGKTIAGNEFKELWRHVDDVGTFYLMCMHCIRQHALKDTTFIFNDIAKYIRSSIMFGGKVVPS